MYFSGGDGAFNTALERVISSTPPPHVIHDAALAAAVADQCTDADDDALLAGCIAGGTAPNVAQCRAVHCLLAARHTEKLVASRLGANEGASLLVAMARGEERGWEAGSEAGSDVSSEVGSEVGSEAATSARREETAAGSTASKSGGEKRLLAVRLRGLLIALLGQEGGMGAACNDGRSDAPPLDYELGARLCNALLRAMARDGRLGIRMSYLRVKGRMGPQLGLETIEEREEAMIKAAGAGNVAMVVAMLDEGAAVEAKDDDGWSPMMLASVGGHLPVVEALLARGADVEGKNEKGLSALMLAAAGGFLGVVEALVDRGADVEVKDEDELTALMYASMSGHAHVVEALRRRGALD